MRSKLRDLATTAAGWSVFVLFFELLSRTINDPLLAPGAFKVLQNSALLLYDKVLVTTHFYATVAETLVSTCIAILLGVPLGLLLGRYKPGRALFESPVDWLRSIPATALFPMMMLIFGIGSMTRVAIAIYGALFAIAIPTMYGAADVDQDRLRSLIRSGLTAPQRLFHAIIWEAMPSILAGLRLAISSALVLIVVGEMFIGANRGLGYLIMRFQERYQTAEMYGTIVIIGILGYFLNRIIRAMQEFTEVS